MTRAAATQVRVPGDRPREPVDVRGLERRDLAERVAVELAELDQERVRFLERRIGRPAEVEHAAALKGSGGVRGPRPLRLESLARGRRRIRVRRASRAPGRRSGSAAGPGRTCRRVRSRGDPAVASAGRPGRRLAASVPSPPCAGAPPRTRSRSSGRLDLAASADFARRTGSLQLRVRRVDLGHDRRCPTGHGRVVAGHVRVVLARQAAPGRLDRRCGRAGLDAEHLVRVPFRHPAILGGGPRLTPTASSRPLSECRHFAEPGWSPPPPPRRSRSPTGSRSSTASAPGSRAAGRRASRPRTSASPTRTSRSRASPGRCRPGSCPRTAAARARASCSSTAGSPRATGRSPTSGS